MANVSYPIPPWISNLPDPVQAYSHGLQIGAQVGESQARQQLAQEQMLRQQQKDMVESEIEKQKFQLQTDEKAREYSAQQKFTSLIQGGMDPLQAILQTPEIASKMGPAVSAIRAGQMTPGEQARIGIEQQRLDLAKKSKLIHTQGGGIYRQNEDGTLTTVVEPTPKAPKKAVYKFTKSNGDTVTGTTDDPEIAALKAADDAAKAKKAADEAAPSWLQKKFPSIFGSGETPMPAQTNAPSKIKAIRLKTEAPTDDETVDEMVDDSEE